MSKLFKDNKIFDPGETPVSASIIGLYAWLKDGNTVGSEKFIGTIDNFAFPIRINNSEVARFNTSGNFLLGNPTATGRRLDIKQNTAFVSIGEWVGVAGRGAIYFSESTPATSNYALASGSGITDVNGYNGIYFSANNGRQLFVGLLSFDSIPSYRYGIGVVNPTASVDIEGSNPSRAAIRIRSGSAPTTPNNGDVWFDSSNYFNYYGGGIFRFGTDTGLVQIRSYTGATSNGAIYLGNITPGNDNYGLFGNGTSTYIQGSSDVRLYNGVTINSYFSSTINYINRTTSIGHSDSPTAFADIAASTASNASLRIRSGATPSSPNNGDMWYDGTDLLFRVSSVTKKIDFGFTVTAQSGASYSAINRDAVMIDAATHTLTLPTATINNIVSVKLRVSPTAVTVKTASAGITIDGVDRGTTGMSINNQWDSYTFLADGTNWVIIA